MSVLKFFDSSRHIYFYIVKLGQNSQLGQDMSDANSGILIKEKQSCLDRILSAVNRHRAHAFWCGPKLNRLDP